MTKKRIYRAVPMGRPEQIDGLLDCGHNHKTERAAQPCRNKMADLYAARGATWIVSYRDGR